MLLYKNISFVPTRDSDRASRYAVLYTLFDITNSKHACVKSVVELSRIWANKVQELAAAGWKVADTDKKVSYLKNCHPEMVVINEVFRSCGKNAICPFCYAREVKHIYNKIEKAYFNYDDCKLITKNYSIVLPSDDALDDCLKGIRNEYEKLYRRAKAFGGYYNLTLHYVGSPILRIRYVLLSNQRGKKCYCVEEYSKITKQELSVIIGKLLAYPVELLVNSASDTIKALQLRANKRLSATYGYIRSLGH